MNWVKEKFAWLKQKWTILASSLVLFYFLFSNRAKVKEIVSVFDKNKDLEGDATNGVRQINNGLVDDIITVNADTLQQVADIKQEYQDGIKRINGNKNVYVRELAGKTNDELAAMLKKEDES